MTIELAEKFTMQVPFMTVFQVVLIFGSTSIILTVLSLMMEINIARKETERKLSSCDIIIIIFYALALYAALTAISACTLADIMKDHGCENPMKYKADIQSVWKSIRNTPTEDLLPDTSEDKLIIYYRFGCSDCELLYHKMEQELQNIPNVYWIATRSEQGKEIRKKYPVKTVPSGVVIKDGKTKTRVLYKKNRKDITLNIQNLRELEHAMENEF